MSVRHRDPRAPGRGGALRRGPDRRRARLRGRAARALRSARARSCCARASSARRELDARRHARLPRRDPRGARGRLASRAAARRPPGPPGRDHRADRPQDGHQRAQLGRPRLHGRLRGLQLADLGEHDRRAGQPVRRDRAGRSSTRRRRARSTRSVTRSATLLVRPRGWHLPERHLLVDGEPLAGALFDFGFHFFHNARRAARQRQRAVLLPAEDGEPPRGAAVERGVRVRRGRAGARARHDQGDGPDRDAPGGLRDGRDPLRAARPLGRAERRPLGLHVQRHQVLPRPPRVRAAGPQLR